MLSKMCVQSINYKWQGSVRQFWSTYRQKGGRCGLHDCLTDWRYNSHAVDWVYTSLQVAKYSCRSRENCQCIPGYQIPETGEKFLLPNERPAFKWQSSVSPPPSRLDVGKFEPAWEYFRAVVRPISHSSQAVIEDSCALYHQLK